MMARLHKFVRHAAVEDHLRLGWLMTAALCGTYHGQLQPAYGVAVRLIHCRTVNDTWGNGCPLIGYQGSAIEPKPGPKGMRVIARANARPVK